MNSQRTKNYFNQVGLSSVFKFIAAFLSFLIIPLMIDYLGVVEYGIWSTLLSILMWILMFDFGMANGLRNKISESLTKDKVTDARGYISTTYFSIALISLFFIIVCNFIFGYVDWQSVFNSNQVTNNDLILVIRISITFLLINFTFSIINQVFHGTQSSSMVSVNQAVSNLGSCILVYLLNVFTEPSLILLAIVYGVSILFSNCLLSLWFYSKNIELRPAFIDVKQDKLRSIFSLGIRFFVVQIAVIVLFTTDKIIITQLFSPDYVTSYDLVYKVFSVITLIHALFISPLWSSFSQAFFKNDYIWIKKMINNQLKLFAVLVVGCILLILLFPTIIYYWVGNVEYIDFKVYSVMGLYVIILSWNNIFSMFINATGYLRVSLIATSIISIVNIPLSILLVKFFNLGIDGVLWATIICLSAGAVLGPLQYRKIINNRGAKIWFN